MKAYGFSLTPKNRETIAFGYMNDNRMRSIKRTRINNISGLVGRLHCESCNCIFSAYPTSCKAVRDLFQNGGCKNSVYDVFLVKILAEVAI
jgi:hypothetical protein